MSSLKSLMFMSALMAAETMPVMYGEQRPHEYKKKKRSKEEKRKRKIAKAARKRNRGN